MKFFRQKMARSATKTRPNRRDGKRANAAIRSANIDAAPKEQSR